MTDKMTHWDIARYANTMAVQSTIAIDPTKITVRIKNKLLKWLDQSHLDGGYRSEARKLGELLTRKFQLPTTMTTWRGVEARVTNEQMASELQELLRADWAAELLERPHMNKGWYRQRYDEAMRLSPLPTASTSSACTSTTKNTDSRSSTASTSTSRRKSVHVSK